jgi:hypothetical protein
MVKELSDRADALISEGRSLAVNVADSQRITARSITCFSGHRTPLTDSQSKSPYHSRSERHRSQT